MTSSGLVCMRQTIFEKHVIGVCVIGPMHMVGLHVVDCSYDVYPWQPHSLDFT